MLDGNWLNEKEKAFYREVSADMTDSLQLAVFFLLPYKKAFKQTAALRIMKREKLFYHTHNQRSASLRSLCDFLGRYYGKKVLLLLDEYDTPMQEAYVIIPIFYLLPAAGKTIFIQRGKHFGFCKAKRILIFTRTDIGVN